MLLDTNKWFDEFVGKEDWKSMSDDEFYYWVLDDGAYYIRTHAYDLCGDDALLEVLKETRTMSEENLNDWDEALEEIINCGEYNETIFDIIDYTLDGFIRRVLMREYKKRLG